MRAAIIAALLVLAGCAAPQSQPIDQIGYNLMDDSKTQAISQCQIDTFIAFDQYMTQHPEVKVTEADVRDVFEQCLIERGLTI